MNFDAPIWIETIRLIRKFFPESRSYLQHPSDLQLDSAWDILRAADSAIQRVSLDPTVEDSALLRWILTTASYQPAGRAVVVPDCGCSSRLPFVCDVARLAERVDEVVPEDWGDIDIKSRPTVLFDCGSDTFIAFESGEAFLVDHEGGVSWARSRTSDNA